MTLLLVCILSLFLVGLRSGSKRADVKGATPVLIGCFFVAVAYLSLRVV